MRPGPRTTSREQAESLATEQRHAATEALASRIVRLPRKDERFTTPVGYAYPGRRRHRKGRPGFWLDLVSNNQLPERQRLTCVARLIDIDPMQTLENQMRFSGP